MIRIVLFPVRLVAGALYAIGWWTLDLLDRIAALLEP